MSICFSNNACPVHIVNPANTSTSVGPGEPVIGTGTPGCKVNLCIDNVLIGYISIDQCGRWYYQPPATWSRGGHCVRAVLCCPCGSGTHSPTDTSCFEVPGIKITGPPDGGEADPQDPVTGIGEPECEAELYIDGILVSRVPIDGNGNWTYQPPTPWTEGCHCVRAILRCPGDTSPNPPEDESCFEVTLPSCMPPLINQPELNAVIASSRPSIAGRGLPNSQVQVCVLNSLGATVFCETATMFEDGEWGVQSPVDLPDDTYTIIATQLSGACIPSDASRTFSVFTTVTAMLNVNLVSLRRGQTFRTVDMVMTGAATPNTALTGYYLLLTPGQPMPSPSDVIGYNDPAALTDGNAVRGKFSIPLTGATQTFSFILAGKENIMPLSLETGVMDGFNYNVYVVGVTTAGESTGVLTLFESAIGMPFASGNGVPGDPFFVRMCTPAEMTLYPDLTAGNPGNRAGVTENARILDNIEGMQALYDETGGVHGMPDSLSLQYRLDGAFDLANYEAAWNGNGWRPIGNIDSSLEGAPLSGAHIFTGTAETPAEGTAISNLRINAAATAANPVLVRGLFGQTQGVELARFSLPDAIISAMVTGTSNTSQTGKIGALAGYSVGGRVGTISLGGVSISAGRTATGSNIIYAGGAVGLAQGLLDISSITASAVSVVEQTAQATVTGGLIGRLDQAEANTSLQDLQVMQADVRAYQTLGGVIGEINNGISQMNNVAIGDVTLTHTGFRVGGIVGNLVANSASVLQNLTVNQIQMGPANPPTTAGYAGGLIGQIVQTAPCTVQDSQVLSGTIHSGGRVGGAFGSLNVSTAEFVIRNVNAAADTRPNNGPAGGHIGRIDINTKIASALLVDNCRVTAASLTVTSTNTSSAFVGGFVGYLSPQSGASGAGTMVVSFVDCAVSANVSHPFGMSTGGFVGSAALSSYLRCRAAGTVTGSQNPGGFCGNGAGNASITDPNLSTLQFILCQARGNVASTDVAIIANVATGGFGGSIAYALIDRCFASGAVSTAGDDNAAGLIGLSTHRLFVRDSYALGATATSNNGAGGILGTGSGAQIERCYAAGNISAARSAGGLAANLSNDGSETGRLTTSFALNPSVVSLNAGGATHRVCAVLGGGAQLVSNYALNTMVLTSGGTTVIPVDNPNGLDGQSMDPSELAALITAQGWNTTTVWDTSTIAALGRPTLFENPEI